MPTTSQTEVTPTQKEPELDRNIFTFKAAQVVWLVLGILEGLLALRFVLKLIAANPNTPITVFIYGLTGIFLLPFTGLTATPSAGGMVLEIPTMIAMLVYGLAAWGIERLIWVIFYRPKGPITQTTTTDKHTR